MRRLNYGSRFFLKLYLTYVVPIACLSALIIALFLVHYDPSGTLLSFDQIVNNISSTQLIVIFSLVTFTFVALFLGLFYVRRVTRPFAQIIDVCEAMGRSIYDQKVTTLSADEVGILGDTLNRLGDEITKKIQTISHERAQLKTILAGMMEGIIALDHDDRIEFCNRAAYRLLDAQTSDYRGLKLSDAPGFRDLKEVADLARASTELVKKELTFSSKDHERILETYATPYSRANISGVIIVVNDITRIRRLERVRRDFVANVSHEIKTPLTAIKGYTETLLGGALDDQANAKRFVEKVDVNATRLANLVQDFLSLARIESQEDSLSITPTNWNPIVKQVVNQHEHALRQKNLELSVVEPEKPLVVLGEKEAMHQVLDNLVTNAIRYTQSGGKIKIKLRRQEKQGIVEVEDTGIGIPSQHLDRIFERFYRVDKARSREVGGTGLGLSIVRNLVDSMHGSINVESQVGRGSRFCVNLDLSKVN